MLNSLILKRMDYLVIVMPWLNGIISKSDLTINDFCTLTGVSRDMLYKWRSGNRVIPLIQVKMFQLIEWVSDNDLLYKYVKEI